jgi:signal transduction histidine kinase/CheY-like chemotaxis protein
MRELGAEPGATRRIELHARRSDGTWRLFEAVARNLLDVPAVHGIVVNSRDITDSRRLEEQFFQAQKLESVGRLAGGVAHDFNNLLIGVLGYADFLEEGIREGKPSLEDLAEIRKAGERARDLTRQLLAVARRQVIRPQVIDVNALVRDSEKLLQRVMGEDVAIDVRLAEELRPVKADPGQLQQVILNLAVNARDAMPRGGRFRVETADVEVDGGRAPPEPGVQPGGWVTLTVSDTGHGMSPETQTHLFEPFFTTKPAGQGTGLGLATVYGIVKQSGGHIGFRSQAGTGTTFRVWLPATAEPVPAPRQPPERPGLQARPGTGTILVVEDATAVRDLVVRALRGAGYAVLEASNGRQAIEVAEKAPGPIRLLLTDVVMPEMSGRAVAERLASWHPGLRVLYMSGYARDAIAQHGVLEPGTEFLAKPFTPAALLSRVRAVLDAV